MTYCAIHVEEFFVLRELKPDPRRIGVAVTVPLGKHRNCLLPFAIHVQPPWALRNEKYEQHNQSREHHLQPNGQLPAGIPANAEATSDSTACENGAHEPEGVAVSGQHAAMSRVRGLHDVDWSGGADDGDAEAEQEAPAHELVYTGIVDRGSRDDGAEDNEDAADQHAHPTAEGVNGRAHEG